MRQVLQINQEPYQSIATLRLPVHLLQVLCQAMVQVVAMVVLVPMLQGKHPWHLGRFPQKNEAAVVVHCFFTLSVMALCTAFRLWQVQGAPELVETSAPA